MKKTGTHRPGAGWKTTLRHTALLMAIFVAASAAGFLFRQIGWGETNIVVVYLLAVLITAWLTRSFVFGILSSFLATFLFCYLFTEPRMTFSVNDFNNYIITFITMTSAALITGALTTHAKQSEHAARSTQAETKAIYDLTNRLTGAKDMQEIASAAVAAISACFSCKAACLCFDGSGMPEAGFIQQAAPGTQKRRTLSDRRAYKQAIESLSGEHLAGDEFYDWPVRGNEAILGVIRIPTRTAQSMHGADLRLLHAMIESTALAMDRCRSGEQRMYSREETEKERYRSNLLRAISHDLRTPLSGLIGSCEMLLDMTDPDTPQHAVAEDMRREANWLHSLVENILSLTRLQDGSLSLSKQVEAVEEIVAAAVGRMAKRAPEYGIQTDVPGELILVPMDARLIEQVLINLLDNAVLHAESKDGIEIIVARDADAGTVRFTVQDRGVGIVPEDLPHIFEMFYTRGRGHADAGHGIGLGLSICKTIVAAHGGTITAENREDGPGARFTFTLPVEEGVSNGTE